MRDEELLKCPLLHELDATHRNELLETRSDLREKVAACLTRQANAADVPAVSYTSAEPTGTQGTEKKVHKWTPATPMSRRCLKE